ncbi:MAG: AAA family ATPase [Clostridiales Family XIII bacterium]|jgi:DNA repair ATPase RecN|nr:AAA family ATPase [Clostridiales Family XIII bacterium]
MAIKISSLQAENVKRIKAVTIEPSPAGLTVIGGRNGQGKTSVLDSITWALGGEKYRPSEPRRDGSLTPPALRIELSNGLVAERKGKSSALKVVDPSGNKAGQALLDSFVSQFALDLPRFLNQNTKDKARTLLGVIGVGDKLYELDDQEARLYNQRTEIGRIAEQKKHAAAEMESYPDAPSEPVSASELIKHQQDILARNGENQRKRAHRDDLKAQEANLTHQIAELQKKLYEINTDLATANKDAAELVDESTEELEANIAEIDETNRKVRTNQDKEKAESEAADYSAQYDDLTGQIETVRKDKLALLDGADLPLDGLSVQDGELTYGGYKWDNMSGSDQMKVATAIVRKLHPDCGFVLLDKLEQMDTDTLDEFGEWLKSENLQAIATRVSVGDECQIIIEDGYVKGAPLLESGAEGKEKGSDGNYNW